MNIYDSKLYAVVDRILNLMILNIFWMVSCVPIITIVPATSAMFSVVRQWKLYEDTSVVRAYFRYFKENFKQSIMVGVIWSGFFIVLFFNYFYISQEQSILKVAMTVPTIFLSVLFIAISSHLFSIMAHYQVNWKDTIKYSFILTVGYLPTTLVILVILGCMFMIFILFPVTMLFIFSLSAYINFSMCHSVYQKIEEFSGNRNEKGENV